MNIKNSLYYRLNILKYIYFVWGNQDGKEHSLNSILSKDIDNKDITSYRIFIVYIK